MSRVRLAVVSFALFLAAVVPCRAAGARCRIAVGGDYPSGYAGLLARQGIPRAILLDYQLAEPETLRKYDLVIVSQMAEGIEERAMDALMEYVRAGGTALLDSTCRPPEAVVPGRRGKVKEPPAIVVGGSDNPLKSLLGGEKHFTLERGVTFLDPDASAGVRVLARYDGKLMDEEGTSYAAPNAGTPAVFEKPLGKGLLVYCSPALGFSLALEGSALELLANGLIRYLGKGAVVAELVPEGPRLARRESTGSMGSSFQAPDIEAPADAAPPARRSPSSPAADLPAGAEALDANSDVPDFNLPGTYLTDRGRSEILLNYWNARTHLSITFTDGGASLAALRDGKTVSKARISFPLAREIPFLVKERGDQVVLLAAERTATLSVAGLWPGKIGTRGHGFSGLRFQPVEPVHFSDDFMRTAAEQSPWKVVTGWWSAASAQNPDMGANPFVYSVSASGIGLATAGYPFWDNYTFEASAKPVGAKGALGLAFYSQGPKDYLLFLAPVEAASPKPAGRFELVRVRDGKERVLAEHPGALAQGQWYRLSVRIEGKGITASVDGVPVLAAQDATFSGGGIGLYARDASARFDDVLVQPASAPEAPVTASLDGALPRFAGSIDLDSWATPATQWDPEGDRPGLFWRHGRYYGDFTLTYKLPPADAPRTGEAAAFVGLPEAAEGSAAGQPYRFALLLAGHAAGEDAGYALSVGPAGKAAEGFRYHLSLLRQGQTVAQANVNGGREPALTLRRAGGRLQAWLDGRRVLEFADPKALPAANRLGFLAEGFRARMSRLRLQAGRVLDCDFDLAPTDWWVGSGTWELTNRWSCTPDWSWFGGMSAETAAIWLKRPFTGDVALDYYVGPRMWGPGDQNSGRPVEVCSNFNTVLCGDGKDVKKGYSFILGADGSGGVAQILRNGEVVAHNDAFHLYTTAHNRWFEVHAEKQGKTVSIWLEGQRVLSYDDPNPLPGGYAGIWTRDNGILIPRVTAYYQEMGAKRLSVP